MRILKFIVDKQIITQDPTCDFSGLVPGTEGYVMAEFSFSKEWDGCRKVVGFYSMMGTEYEPQYLKDGKTCAIPPEALVNRSFKMKVFAKKSGYKIATNKIKITQDGGK